MTEELITLEEVKLHCRIDGDEEDQLISGYIAASLEACQIHIGRRFDDGLEFTPAIKIGCMMFIAHLYENRQIVADNAKTHVPMTIGALWTAYRDVGCTDAVATIKTMYRTRLQQAREVRQV